MITQKVTELAMHGEGLSLAWNEFNLCNYVSNKLFIMQVCRPLQ